MSEAVFNIVQFGRQSNIGTPVAADIIFGVDAGFLGFELDRASESPDEDYGNESREQSGRGSTGVRLATASLPFVARFQDIFHPLELAVQWTSGTPTGTASPYSYEYVLGGTASAVSSHIGYTVEYGVDGSTQDEWEAQAVIATGLELGFDALSAPGNQMWRGTLDLMAFDAPPAAITGGLSAPSTLETMEGHRTTLVEGTTATAFGSLANSLKLKQFSVTINRNVVGRAYGGNTDQATAWGQSEKSGAEFSALIGIDSTSDTNIFDVFNVSGDLPTDRRWRIVCDGTGDNSFTIDARVRFTAVPIGDHENERLYSVTGVFVRDSTLGGHGKITLTNSVSVIP